MLYEVITGTAGSGKTGTLGEAAELYGHLFGAFDLVDGFRQGFVADECLVGCIEHRITSYNVCYTKLLRGLEKRALTLENRNLRRELELHSAPGPRIIGRTPASYNFV